MIVCSCNVLSDHEIRNVVRASREQPPSAPQVYDCLGCSIRCGRCARAVKQIITELARAKDADSTLQPDEHDQNYGVYVINHSLPIEVFIEGSEGP
jgi:bacterioferritin-associated ferredoxin